MPTSASTGPPPRSRCGTKHRKEELFALLDQGLLDIAEQKELVDVLSHEGQRTANMQRVLIGAVGLIVAVFFEASSLQQIVKPWDMRFTAEFRNTWSAPAVAAALMVTGAPCALASVVLLRTHLSCCGDSRQAHGTGAFTSPRAAMAVSLAVSGLLAAFWTASLGWEHYQVLQSARFPAMVEFPYRMLWLPATPLAVAVLSKYVVDTTDDVSRSVGDLKSKMYSYKRL